MKNLFFQFLFFLKTLTGVGQPIPPQPLATLPPVLEENSGMVVLGADSILFINDSGNDAALYLSDVSGQILKTVYVRDFPNRDWEELTYDGLDALYIGDFGNNGNARTDLQIASVSLAQVLYQDTVVPLKIMEIAYQRQQGFPPAPQARHYDMEAMVWAQDSLYLFSKNRTDPFDGKVYQYALPTLSGTYLLAPKDSFTTGAGLMASYWITGAAYHPLTRELVLLGYDKLWWFKQAEPPFFFSGSQVSSHAFNGFTQKESIDFVNDTLLYLSDEASVSGVQRLYAVQLPSQHIGLEEQPLLPYALSLQNTWIKDSVLLDFSTSEESELLYEIFSIDGKRVLFGKLGTVEAGKHELFINTAALEAGGYVLNVLVNRRPNAFKIKKAYPFKN
jgi:hypothetical protein